jgi:Organic solvent tolerance protein OstA
VATRPAARHQPGLPLYPRLRASSRLSGAWPIYKRWQALGSYQYDITDHKPLEELAGIGYDGGCWAAHMMVYHQILLGGQSNNAIYLEIVLRGLTSLGNASNALLSQYVPGASMEF